MAHSSEVSKQFYKLSLGPAGLLLLKSNVTQTGSITSGVSTSASSGVVTTVAAAVVASSSTTFTISNPLVSSSSVVFANVSNYSGVYQTNGVPRIAVQNINAGSFDVVVINSHATNALAGVLNVSYLIV